MIWGESESASLRCRLVGGEAGSRESTRYRAVDIPSRNSLQDPLGFIANWGCAFGVVPVAFVSTPEQNSKQERTQCGT